VKNRSLGEAANGLPFGNRRWQTPVFDFVTAAKALDDLPEPGVICISKPDHRTSQNGSTQSRINQIPKAPRLQGLAEAAKRGRLNQRELDSLPKLSKLACKGSRAWSRVHPHGLIPTVTTAVSPACRFTGRWLHWDQDRLLTVMEARRAQGYPDEEVLIGRPGNQWKIVGNSVARQVALALGLSLREACLTNEKRRQANGQPIVSEIEGATFLSETDVEEGQASSLSTKSSRTTETTGLTSMDEIAIPSKRGFGVLVLSDDEDDLDVSPAVRQKRRALSGSHNTSQNPIILI
jgi:hypothetical protein